jgi:hypothetical protein
MSNVMGRLQAGATFNLTPQEYTALSDLAGALNYWAAQAELPVDVLQEFRDGDPRFVFTASADRIAAIPFTVAPGPYAQTSIFSATAAEYGTGGTGLALAQISRHPGDLDGATGGGSAIQIWRDATTDGDGLWYYNIRMQDGNNQRGTGFSVTFPR